MPQYKVTIGFSPPVDATLPLIVEPVAIIFVAESKEIAGRLANVIKSKEAVGQEIPAELVAEAVK